MPASSSAGRFVVIKPEDDLLVARHEAERLEGARSLVVELEQIAIDIERPKQASAIPQGALRNPFAARVSATEVNASRGLRPIHRTTRRYTGAARAGCGMTALLLAIAACDRVRRPGLIRGDRVSRLRCFRPERAV